jgi:hypothetical protein
MQSSIGQPLDISVAAFVKWADSRWQSVEDLARQEIHKATQARLSVQEWTHMVRYAGFHGDARAVFKEITQADTMSWDDFLRFEKKAREWGSQPQAFRTDVAKMAKQKLLELLHRRRPGPVLRGWRMEIDISPQNGRVSYQEFIEACRRLGMTAHVKSLFEQLASREDGHVRLRDLAPEEAANVDAFVEQLSQFNGLRMEEAWFNLDANRQNAVSYKEFVRFCADIGFHGMRPRQWLFRGLDNGHGRVFREGFDYLLKVRSKPSRPAFPPQQRVAQESGPFVHELSSACSTPQASSYCGNWTKGYPSTPPSRGTSPNGSRSTSWDGRARSVDARDRPTWNDNVYSIQGPPRRMPHLLLRPTD